MIRFLADENFPWPIVTGLRRRLPDVDLVHIQGTRLERAPDETVLEWAAHEGRIVLTRDINTLVGITYRRVSDGLPMPGVIIIGRRLTTPR